MGTTTTIATATTTSCLFVAIVAWVFWPKRRQRLERQGEIPFRNDDQDR